MSFENKLKIGKYYEIECMKYINHKSYTQSIGNNKEYDIDLINKNNKNIKIEVKSDRHINKTGNICIEYKCNDVPSGITATKSKYWVIFEIYNDDDYNMYIIKSKIIKDMIKDHKYKRIVMGGDGYRAGLYLFDKSLFKDYIRIVKDGNNITYI